MQLSRILVPVDFSSHQELVLKRAVDLAKEKSAELVLLHCAQTPQLASMTVEPVFLPAESISRFAQDHSEAVQKKMKELHSQIGLGEQAHIEIRRTTPVDGILEVAQSEGCDLIVMGSHGSGMDRFLLGSVAEAVTRRAPCPVLVVRAEASLSKVVVGIDFSPFSAALVGVARQLCDKEGEIHLVHTWMPPHLDSAHLFGSSGHQGLLTALEAGVHHHSDKLGEFAESLPEDSRYQLYVTTGKPAKAILEYAEEREIGTLFVGAHESDFLESLLGSTSDRVLRHAAMTCLVTGQSLGLKSP